MYSVSARLKMLLRRDVGIAPYAKVGIGRKVYPVCVGADAHIRPGWQL